MHKLFIALFLLSANAILALDPVILTDDTNKHTLGLYLEILEDKDGSLTLDDTQKPEMEKFWTKSQKEVPNFGFTKSAYWVRFKLESHSAKEYFLEIAYPHLDRIDFYNLTPKGLVFHKKAGDFLPFREREIQYKNFVFVLNSENTRNAIYYFRFESGSSMQFPMMIWSPTAFSENKTTEMVGLGLYFGIMIVMILYNLFVWMSVRDKSYLYYVGYIVLSALYLSNYYGLTYQYLWTFSPELYNIFFPSILFWAFLFAISFTSHFLQSRENTPLLYKINQFLFIVLILGGISSLFVSYRLSTTFGIIMGAISSVWMLSLGAIMVLKNYRPARFYFLAWISLLIGAIVISLKAFGLIPYHFFTEHSVQLGSTFEVILLSLGLADRINDLKKQNEVAAIQNQEELQKLNSELEKKVNERTSELELEKIKTISRMNEFQKYNEAISSLTKSRAIASGNIVKALDEITEVCAHVLDVERVSIWRYDKVKQSINCLNLFEKTKSLHTDGMELFAKDFPAYFQFIEEERILLAEDAHTNPATIEFSEVYLTPLNIFSMLDVPIWTVGSIAGILCFEHTGNKRTWTLEQTNFATSISSLISNAFESDYKNQAQLNEVLIKEEIESLNTFTHLVNSLSNLNEIFIEVSKYAHYNYYIDAVWLFLPDEGGEYLYSYKVYSYVKLPEDKYNYVMNMKAPLTDERGGMLYKTFQRKKSFYLRRIPKLEIAIDQKFAEMLSVKSILYVPLVRKEKCVGILGFSNLERDMKLSKNEIRKLSNFCSQIAGAIDTNHLLQKVESAKQESEKLTELMKNINSVSSLTDIMSFIMYYLETEYDFNDYFLVLNDTSKEQMVGFSFTSPNNSEKVREYFINFKIPYKKLSGILAEMVKNKKSIFIEKQNIPEEDLLAREWIERGNFDYLFLLPLVIYDELIGILFLHSPQTLIKDETRLKLERFSDLIAGSVLNAGLLKKVEEAKELAEIERSLAQIAQSETELARKEIEGLNEIIQQVNSVSSLVDVMTFIMFYLERKYEFSDFWLVLKDDKSNYLQTFSYVSPDAEEASNLFFENFNLNLEEDSYLSKTYQEQKILYLPIKENTDLSQVDKEIIEKGKFTYLLQIPFVIYEQTIGILILHSKRKKGIYSQTLDKLQSFSNQMAGAVNNSKLFKQAQDAKEEAEAAKKEAELARDKSERLLLNILPKDVAKELKEKGSSEPVLFESVSVLFTDFKGFTQIAESMPPRKLVEELDQCFSYFDSLMDRYGLEKLKTIGDSYMCAGGIPRKNTTHAIDCALAALEIQSVMKQMKELKETAGNPYWELRLGIHSGSLIAGVIGEKKFAYDVWGDTVNTASRMESSGTPGKINISGATYEFVKELFECEYRGEVQAKNKGKVTMYYLIRIKKDFSKDEEGRVPNAKFWQVYAGVGL